MPVVFTRLNYRLCNALLQVWVFERIQASSHVAGLCLQANCVLGDRDISSFHPSWNDCDHKNVSVRTLWDNPLLHEEVSFSNFCLELFLNI